MTKEELVDQVKLNLGITTDKQDLRIELLVDGVISECKGAHGITLDIDERTDHALFVIDYASHRYKSKLGDIPEDLMWRLKHFYIHDGGKDVQP